MKTVSTLFITLMIGLGLVGWEPAQSEAAVQQNRVTIRIERYPRPPYSGATYYIYERGGEVICTKLEVCNKYDDCETEYKKGRYRDEIDVETGDPYATENAVVIPTAKLRKHACLTRFKLISR